MSRVERQIQRAGSNKCYITKKSDKNSVSVSRQNSNIGKITVFCINYKDKAYLLKKIILFTNNGVTEAL